MDLSRESLLRIIGNLHHSSDGWVAFRSIETALGINATLDRDTLAARLQALVCDEDITARYDGDGAYSFRPTP